MRALMLSTVAAMGIALGTVPAAAAVTVNAGDTGMTFDIVYSGQANGSPAPAISGAQAFEFTGTSNGGLTYNFAYDLSNTSGVGSTLRSFGFNVDQALSSVAGLTGFMFGTTTQNNFPEGLGQRDACFRQTSQGNCTGGQGTQGVLQNGTLAGTFSLTFGSVYNAIELDNFAIRFQAINPAVNGTTSGVGIGTVVTAVPEASTWAMMIGGFGLVGGALRRSRAARLQLA